MHETRSERFVQRSVEAAHAGQHFEEHQAQ
jgi:hypothetical protein